MSGNEIRELAEALKIPYLIHFTRTSNLESILKHGLQPRSACKGLGVEPAINDDLRLDGREDGISLSISHPNGRMFYKVRKDHPDEKWVILAVHPKILWEKKVLFCKHNAADVRVSGQSADVLSHPDSFAAMFSEIDGHPSRAEQSIRAFDPTDVQAEILVMEGIAPELIRAAAFDDAASQVKFAKALGDRQQIVLKPNKGLFAERTYRRRNG